MTNEPGLIGCETCGLVQQLEEVPRGHLARCAVCESVLVRERHNSRVRTMAFTMAALCLYVPANLYPIMIMEYLGRHTENTVWSGARELYKDGMWYVAAIVFAASILVPLLKLLGLLFLVASRGSKWRKARTLIYKAICRIGPWAMLDVFLLAVLVALIRFGGFATVIPGIGVYAFVSVVIFTMLASASFDSRIIWKEAEV